MSLLNLNLNDVPDEKVVEPGEYQLVVTKAEVKTSTNSGNEMIAVFFNIVGETDAKMVADYLVLPTKGSDQNNKRLRDIKSFCLACGVDISGGINVEEFKGKQPWANLKIDNSDEYGASNKVGRYVIPK